MRPLFDLSSGQQVYFPFDPRLEWPGEGPLFKSDSNKCQGLKMRPQFESLKAIIEVSPGALGQETISGRSIFHLTKDWNGLHAERHYLSLHAFASFTLPILTDKNLNITLLPRKSKKRCKRETS